MSANHQRGDLEGSLMKESEKQSHLEKLMSFSSRVSDSIKNKGRILALASLLAISPVYSGCQGETSSNEIKNSNHVEQTQLTNKEKHKNKDKTEKEFSDVPAYVGTQEMKIERNPLLDEKAKIEVEGTDNGKGVEIFIGTKDYKEDQNPETSLFIESMKSSPLIIHSPNVSVSDIEQKAYANLSSGRGQGKGAWQSVFVPRKSDIKEGVDVKEGIERVLDITNLGDIVFSDSEKEIKAYPKDWKDSLFLDVRKDKEAYKLLEEKFEKGWDFTLIEPFVANLETARKHETARKYKIEFEQKYPGKENVWVLQGIDLENLDSLAFGKLERKLSGPIEIEGDIDLWAYKEGVDFEWLERKSYTRLINSDKHSPRNIIQFFLPSWHSENDEALRGLIWPLIGDYAGTSGPINVYKKKSSKPFLSLDSVYYTVGGIESWGKHKIGKKLEKRLYQMLSFASTQIGKGKGKLEGKYIGKIKFEKEILGLKRYGEPKVYTIKEGEKSIKPAIMSAKKEVIRFMADDNYKNLNDFGFGIFPVLYGKIQGPPIIFTEKMLDILPITKNNYIKDLEFSYPLRRIDGKENIDEYKIIE